MDKFSERLKELRTEKGLSLTQLSELTGISHTALVYWENDRRVPNANAVLVLAKFFEVTADSFRNALTSELVLC